VPVTLRSPAETRSGASNVDPFIFSVIVLALTGSVIGFASGLLGLGGGFLMVPVQYWLLSTIGVDPTTAIRVSFGTSLAVVIPTALSSAWGHHCRQCVLTRHLSLMAVPAFLGAVLGSVVAAHAPGNLLTTLSGVVVLVFSGDDARWNDPRVSAGNLRKPVAVHPVGTRLWHRVRAFGYRGRDHHDTGDDPHPAVFCPPGNRNLRCRHAGGIGWRGYPHIINGLGVSGLPPYSVGYVNLVQWLVLVAVSVPMAQIGVRAAHTLPADRIKQVFVLSWSLSIWT